MKRSLENSTAAIDGARQRLGVKRQAPSSASTRRSRLGGDLEKVLRLIKAKPGIRPSEINRLLNRAQSDALRATLIKRGLIRKEKDGPAIRYYPVNV
jgi:hypothetical protein